MKRLYLLSIAGGVAMFALQGVALAEGAIARNENGATGISYNQRGERAAENRALDECSGRCRVVLRFRGECAAIATGRGGGAGWARGERRGRAEEAAMEQCRAEGTRECRISLSACDDR
jgi:hypothetical protein